MRHWLSLSVAFLMLTSAVALAQVNLKPDTTPRLPPQPGQGLPLEDQQFIGGALGLSEAQIQASRLAAGKAGADGLKDFSQKVAADHEKIRQGVEQLAQKYQVARQPHPSQAWWQGELKRIGALDGPAFEREYMAWQLQAMLALVTLYQTQASNTTQTDLSRFAIVTLNQIQRQFDEAKQLGARHGVTIDTVRQPPQY